MAIQMGKGADRTWRRLPASPRIAIVGATGAAGSTVLSVLLAHDFPRQSLRLFASRHSAGRLIEAGGERFQVEEATSDRLSTVDLAFLSAGAAVSRALAPGLVRQGAIAIDKSSAFRSDPSIPLVVPEVNLSDLDDHNGLIAAPNCVAIPLSLVLAPLHEAFGLSHVSVATYQAASGAGTRLLEELQVQRRAAVGGALVEAHVYPHILYDNVVPGGWRLSSSASTVMEEEEKVVDELRRVLHLPGLDLSVTTVRVPVSVGHSMALFIEFSEETSREQVYHTLAGSPGLAMTDDPAEERYPTPAAARGGDEVLVGRLHETSPDHHRISMFVSSDNLRKGAALNSVQIAEQLLPV